MSYKELIITTDLLKVSMGSNNRSLKRYITYIIYGNEVDKKVLSNNDISTLSEQEYEILKKYILCLNKLHNISFKGKNNYQNVGNDLLFELNKYVEFFSKFRKRGGARVDSDKVSGKLRDDSSASNINITLDYLQNKSGGTYSVTAGDLLDVAEIL